MSVLYVLVYEYPSYFIKCELFVKKNVEYES